MSGKEHQELRVKHLSGDVCGIEFLRQIIIRFSCPIQGLSKISSYNDTSNTVFYIWGISFLGWNDLFSSYTTADR